MSRHSFIIEADNPSSGASLILSHCTDSRIFLFVGEMGSGKTTTIKELCLNLGYQGEVTSPTYSIINEYRGQDFAIFHMDLYRLRNIDEAFEIGIEEYLYEKDAYCFIEWPQIILDIIEIPVYLVEIQCMESMIRQFKISYINK